MSAVAGDTQTSRILIGVCSCHRTADRRRAVRASWMRRLPAGVTATFFVGEGPKSGEPDVVQVSASDDYPGLTRKVHAFLQHAVTRHQFDYLFKCDDDTYVVAERLFDLIQGGPAFVGSSIFAPWFASGGAGYLLSREAACFVARSPDPGDGAEDVWIAALLRAGGFPLTPTPH